MRTFMQNNSLPVPKPALQDPDAQEVIRAWVANNGHDLHCSLAVGQWDPAVWGNVFSDIVRHVVDAEVEDTGRYDRELIRTIVDRFLDEVTELVPKLDQHYANRH